MVCFSNVWSTFGPLNYLQMWFPLIGSQPHSLPQWYLQWISWSAWRQRVCPVSGGEVLLLPAASGAAYYQACKMPNGWDIHFDCISKINVTIIMYAVIFQTGVCPHGHYCPRGTGYPHTFPCQAGKYRNNTLGHSGEACILCPSRHYCDRPGTHMPLVCPQVGISSIVRNRFVACVRQCDRDCACVTLLIGFLLSGGHFYSQTVSWRNLQLPLSSQWWVWVLPLWRRPVLHQRGTLRALWKLQRALLL